MNPRDLLVLAEELIEGDTEAHWRSAVSRGYYAAFHVARQFLERVGFVVPRMDGSHRYLSDRLNNCGHAATVEAGRQLEDLRRLRNQCDYDLWRRLSRRDADDQVTQAGAIIDALETAGADETVRAAITLAMRAYEAGRGESTWRG